MGESYGIYTIGNDEAIFPHITSCNIACGFHGGDAWYMEKTISSALKHNVRIGAHPSYPDLHGFGRRNMQLRKDELKSILKYQIAALKGMAESQGAQLAYVKPHGALYNTAFSDPDECATIIDAIKEIDPSLFFMGLAHSLMEDVAKAKDITFIREGFADRRYTSNGHLMSRSIDGAVIQDPSTAAAQVLSMLLDEKVICDDGSEIVLRPQSICIHRDNPSAVNILLNIDTDLVENNIAKKSFA